MPIRLTPSCREVVRMLLAREDRALDWRERFALAVHLRICVACPRFEAQVVFMRQALGRWRRYADRGDVAATPDAATPAADG